MINRRELRVKFFVRVTAVFEQIVFISAKRGVFVLGQKLTVVQPYEKRFVFDKRREESLQKRNAIFSSFKPSSRGSESSAFRCRFAFVEQAYRPTIYAFCA